MTLMTSLLIASLARAASISCPIPVPNEAEAPWIASPRREDYSWMSRVEWCERFLKNLADPARAGTDLVFMGDSITQGWTDLAPAVWSTTFGSLRPLRLGIGGDRTQNLLWRMEHGEVEGLNPRVLVLLIGINNLNAGDTPEQTAAGISSVIDRLQTLLPTTKILQLAILPSGETQDDPLRARIQSTNQLMAGRQRPGLVHVDIGSIFLQSDGQLNRELLPDGLHPGTLGYERLAAALAPSLNSLFGADVIKVGTVKE